MVLIHSGSRGLGHQVCTDYVAQMNKAMTRHDITLPDRQLACAPVRSEEGQAYLGAMCRGGELRLGQPAGHPALSARRFRAHLRRRRAPGR